MNSFLEHNPIPPGVSIGDYFSSDTNSHIIKQFAPVLQKYFRPGALTKGEADRVFLNLLMLLTDTVDLYFFKFAARFLTPETYDEIISERTIEHTCGYPLCSKIPKGPDGRFKIDYNAKGYILSDPDLMKFCTKEHAKASRFYQHQLSYEPVFMRTDIAYLPYGKTPYESHTATLEEIESIATSNKISLSEAAIKFAHNAVLATKSILNEEDQSAAEKDFENLVGKLQEISIRERDPNDETMIDMNGVENEDLIGDHTAIEGYKTTN